MERDDVWLTSREVAAYMKTHEQTVRRLLRSGQLAGLLLADRAGWRVRLADLEAFARRRGWKTQAEIDNAR